MEKKSIGINYIYSIIKAMMTVIFPIITLKYTTSVVGSTNLGKVGFIQSLVSWFMLIAVFGVSGYAVREGARIRDDKEKINEFISEILAINVVTVIAAYVLLMTLFFIPKLKSYKLLIVIFSTTIVLSVLGVEWLYNIYEDYKYITIRSFFFQVISLVLLFTIIKGPEDYYKYAIILVISSVGSNILNIIRARKYIQFKFKFNKSILRHVKPMSFIFAMSIASTIYLIMDKNMIGFIKTDAEVSYYDAATKIISILTSFLAAIRLVMTPRVSYLMKKDKKQAEQYNYITAKIILLLSIPSIIGIWMLSPSLVNLFFAADYVNSIMPLRILLIDVFFASMNGFLVNQLLIVHRRDKIATTAVILGAIINVIFNFALIPPFSMVGAAISTCISEGVMFIFCLIMGRDLFGINKIFPHIMQVAFSSVAIVGMFFLAKQLTDNNDLLVLLLTVFIGAGLYFVILLLLKNELVNLGANMLKQKIEGRNKKN